MLDLGYRKKKIIFTPLVSIDKTTNFDIVNSTILINLSLSKGGGGWRKTFKSLTTI